MNMKRPILYGLLIGSLGTVAFNSYLWWQEKNLGEAVQPTSPKIVEQTSAEKDKKHTEEKAPEPLYPERPEKGDRIGSLEIPRLKVKLPVVEGTGDKELAKGVGHYTRSYLPGEQNLSLLAGHRETVFADAGKLKKGDRLITHTEAGTFTYRIDKTWIVDKDDTSVIRPYDDATLILSTCFPFDQVGTAPERYIIRAKLQHPNP